MLPVVIQQRLKNGAIHPEGVEPLLPCSTELFPGMALYPRQRFVPAAGTNLPSVPHSPRSLAQNLVLVYHLPSRSPQPCKPSASFFPPEEQNVTLLKGACILGGCRQLHCYGKAASEHASWLSPKALCKHCESLMQPQSHRLKKGKEKLP